MKFADVKGLSTEEARKKKKELKAELFQARMKNAMGQMTNPISIRQMRRDVARLNMVMSMNAKASGAK